MVEISQNCVAFSEYMNINTVLCLLRNLMEQQDVRFDQVFYGKADVNFNF